jgi:hypothetical protein
MPRVSCALFGFVYLGRQGDRLKIGATLNPQRRKRQIETATGREFDDFVAYHVYAPAACERWLHGEWDDWRTLGEWFADGPELFAEIAEYLEPRQARLDIA